jgi:polyhydroxybutyrate depolymerase
MMAHRLACEISHKIAAIAMVAGSIPERYHKRNAPTFPVSVMVLNGTKDPLVPFRGGDIRFGRKRLGRVLPTVEVGEYWRKHNKCSPLAQETFLPDINPDDDVYVQWRRYHRGEEDSEVILYTLHGGGHTWPGGSQYLPRFIIGNTCQDLDATRVIWDFFQKHERQRRK